MKNPNQIRKEVLIAKAAEHTIALIEQAVVDSIRSGRSVVSPEIFD